MILQAENIIKNFGSKKVLQGVTFKILKGTLTGIVGENGSGKSTLLKILAGWWKPDEGNMKILGDIGYCPQEPLVFPQLTVLENFKYFATAGNLYKRSDKKSWLLQCNVLLEHFQFSQYRNERVNRLSGGTCQKLNLSISLLHKPDLLILDEPFAGFDWETYQRFWDFTLQFRKDGFSILLVTHLLTETSHFDTIYHLKEGCLVCNGSV